MIPIFHTEKILFNLSKKNRLHTFENTQMISRALNEALPQYEPPKWKLDPDTEYTFVMSIGKKPELSETKTGKIIKNFNVMVTRLYLETYDGKSIWPRQWIPQFGEGHQSYSGSDRIIFSEFYVPQQFIMMFVDAMNICFKTGPTKTCRTRFEIEHDALRGLCRRYDMYIEGYPYE